MGDDFEYDVAFSFLAEDEALAIELNDLLEGRVKTFLYSKKQGEVAGTDGEKTFNTVFGKKARLVVVLYRERWGQTPWTRIEETAVRNRAYEVGYDFVKFIPLDDAQLTPQWLPRTQIWIDLKRWGAAGAASIIEARVQELGGEPTEESVQQRAARLERAAKQASERKAFLNSERGVKAANAEFETLRAELDHLRLLITEAATSLSLTLKVNQRQIILLGFRYSLKIYWQYHYANSLDGAELKITLWDGHPPFPGVMHFEEPRQRDSMHFTFDLTPTGVVWVGGLNRQTLTTKDLASFIMKHCMDRSEK